MRTIAYRKSGLDFLYIVVLLLGIFLIVTDITYLSNYITSIFGIAVIGVSVYILIGYFKTPHEAICAVDGDKTLVLPKDIKINTCDITDVSYKRATAKGIQYKWGSITIAVLGNSYKIGYISDCEAVAKEILRLKYEFQKQLA